MDNLFLINYLVKCCTFACIPKYPITQTEYYYVHYVREDILYVMHLSSCVIFIIFSISFEYKYLCAYSHQSSCMTVRFTTSTDTSLEP